MIIMHIIAYLIIIIFMPVTPWLILVTLRHRKSHAFVDGCLFCVQYDLWPHFEINCVQDLGHHS